MEIIGYIASILIGLSLGIIGGGGSILTVPVLVYLFGVDAVAGTSYSLFVVGVTGLVGSINYFKNNLVSVKTAIVFGIPAIFAVYLTRAYFVPAIPDVVFSLGDFDFTKSILLMVLFAIMMIAASYGMIKKPKTLIKEINEMGDDIKVVQKFNYPMILLEGSTVGVLTGLVGAGGGFLIIPALVILSKLPMKKAIGTSLVIIAVKSLIGFTGESSETVINWTLLLTVTGLSVFGIFIGVRLSKKINGEKLKPIFGWFVLLMGVFILLKEILF